MELGLTGRTALVTGASKGIGAVVATTLAEEGCDLVLVARSAEGLERVAGEVRAAGRQARVIAADLSQDDAVPRLWAALGDAAPDILVNNAGAVPSGSIADIDQARLRSAWDLKLFGYIAMCRAAHAAMTARGSGVIVNIIGAAGERPQAGYIAGAGSNAALMAVTRALGASSLAHGVRVVGINPGLIVTERLETLMRAAAGKRWDEPDRWRELLDPKVPPGQPAHIAALVAFLASDRSGNTSGTVITADGGSSAR